MKKIELLSPAGNINCLKAAILAGCDAVYLSGKFFGARAFAGNFSDEELISAINLAHLYGVKVYLAINTLIYEKEVDRFIEYVRFVHKNNIDAVIIQDLGMLDLVRKKFPNLEIHASTQMNIHNYEGALTAKKLGVKRVVMARETSLDVIKKIKNEIDIEVETFVHGALCVSYSGQCLMSSLIGNRSGNRGTCSQCCRKSYDFYDQSGNKLNTDNYLLSMKDLCQLNYLDKIIEAGIDSLKIEGRMKRPSYVYITTSIYRKVIDNYYKTGKLSIDDKDMLQLKKIFNRDFTKGFMLNEKNDNIVNSKRPNHMGILIGNVISCNNGYISVKLIRNISLLDGIRIINNKDDIGFVINKMYINKKEVKEAFKNDIVSFKNNKKVSINALVVLTSCNKQIIEVDNLINNFDKKVLIDVYVKAVKNDNLLIEVSDGKNSVYVKSDFLIESASNRPLSKDILKKQIIKTGNTIYKVRTIKIDVDNDVFINIKDINVLRRRALKKLNEKRLYKIKFIEKDYSIFVPSFPIKKQKSILIDHINDYYNNRLKYDIFYVTSNKLLIDEKCILKIPRVVSKYEKSNNRVLIGDIGALSVYKNFNTDFSFNVVNSYTVSLLHNLGALSVCLSPELNLKQMENIINAYYNRLKKYPNLEVIGKGYLEAMVCKFDLNKKYNIKLGYLKDEYNNKFKVVSNNHYMTIYHYKKIDSIKDDEYYNISVNIIRNNN